MSKIIIDGGRKLFGEISIDGAKNSVLPIMAASVLTGGKNYFRNTANISDVAIMSEILTHLGSSVSTESGCLVCDTANCDSYTFPAYLGEQLRSSVFFLGPLLAKFGRGDVPMPGGCKLGARPVDMHIELLEQMGATVSIDDCVIHFMAPKGLFGADINLRFPSVGVTENAIMAAVLAKGDTKITGCAREPEIIDLVNYLNRCGAKIWGHGSSTIHITGVKSLIPTEFTIRPDRIETVTYLTAAAITGSEIKINNVNPNDVNLEVNMLRDIGYDIMEINGESLLISGEGKKGFDVVKTMPFPDFSTDAQPMFMALSTVQQGKTLFYETIFDKRYNHIPELRKMGADIISDSKAAIVRGVRSLGGARVTAMDLRGGAALVVAGLAADGITEINDAHYINRGYSNIEGKLSAVGAKIQRT